MLGVQPPAGAAADEEPPIAHGLSKPEWRTWRDGNAVDLELYDAARGLFEARLGLGFRLGLGLRLRLRLGLGLRLRLGLG